MRGKLLGVLLLTTACLALALHGVEIPAVIAALAGFELWRVPVVAALYVLVLFARTERFRRLVPTRVAFAPMLAVMSAAFLAINVVPLRMGELVRPYLLAQRGVPFAESVAAVIVERLLDMVALLSMALVASGLLDAPTVLVEGVDVLGLGRRAMIGSIAVLLGLLLAARWLASWGRRSGALAGARIGRVASAVDDAMRGLFARAPLDVVLLLGCTALSWGGSIAACAVVMDGFGVLDGGAGDVLFEWTVTVAAVVLVPTPGFLGGFEAGAIGGLVTLGHDADVARAFALTLHAIQFGSTLAAGIVGFLVLGIGLRTAVTESRTSG